jgi:S-adenosylmethionine:tRNA ribosyltransferase-isomerase
MSFTADGRELRAQVKALAERGEVELEFEPGADPYSVGEAPLPPYIRRPHPRADDRERYQTIYAREPGAIAAPTAGLHFSEPLFQRLEARGVETAEVVLHVGPGTFRPLDDESLREGRLHRERYELGDATAGAVARTRDRGGRVIAVGTTSVRVLESCASGDGQVMPGSGETDIFLRPGSSFSVVDGLITNFHLPRSSLLLLVAAFAGRERVLSAYAEAIARDYRFYSYGDAMLIR